MLTAIDASTFCKVAMLPVCACVFVMVAGMKPVDNMINRVRIAGATTEVLLVIDLMMISGRLLYKVLEGYARLCIALQLSATTKSDI